jgi:hypothetical protein
MSNEKELRTAFLSVTMRPKDVERIVAASQADDRSKSAWAERVLLAELDRLDAERKKKKSA